MRVQVPPIVGLDSTNKKRLAGRRCDNNQPEVVVNGGKKTNSSKEKDETAPPAPAGWRGP